MSTTNAAAAQDMPASQIVPGRQDRHSAAAQHITFTVGSEEYGVDIIDVREIKGWTQATRLPNAPHYVRGVINLRGTMVPIFDLRARFGGGMTDATATHVVVVASVGPRIVGILVDAVSDILTIDRKDIQPVPKMTTNGAEDFISGLVTISGRMVALLTLERMFGFDISDPEPGH